MSVYQDVTNRIVSELEKGAAPWIKPWKADVTADRNIASGKPYRGINRLLLGMTSMSAGYASPVWGTYQQWQTIGAQVRKGEKASHIVFFKPMKGEKPGDDGVMVESSYCVVRGYCVFNADQVDGIKLEQPTVQPSEFERHERCESTLAKSGAVISHGGDMAFYSPTHDRIQMPHKSAFDQAASYYATALHELTHWTGHKSRCAREFGERFGNPQYAFEELVAEMGAAFLCAEHGIQGELRHAGYIGHWLKACRENDRAIFKAAALAQKASDYILSLDVQQQLAA